MEPNRHYWQHIPARFDDTAQSDGHDPKNTDSFEHGLGDSIGVPSFRSQIPMAPRRRWQDVLLNSPSPIHCLIIKNYYCAQITIRGILDHTQPPEIHDSHEHSHGIGKGAETADGSSAATASETSASRSRVVTLVDRLTLMKNPHAENEGERVHVLYLLSGLCDIGNGNEIHHYHDVQQDVVKYVTSPNTRICRLRVFLSQPSPAWSEYKLSDIRLYSLRDSSTRRNQAQVSLNVQSQSQTRNSLSGEHLLSIWRHTKDPINSVAYY